jgi:hypothetical protein
MFQDKQYRRDQMISKIIEFVIAFEGNDECFINYISKAHMIYYEGKYV